MDRKGLGSPILIAVLVLLCLTCQAQQNLVANSSFEDYTSCPSGTGQIYLADGWKNVRGSVDFFNICGSTNFGIPNNYGGHQEPVDGRGYGGLATWASEFSNGREYLGTQLPEPLVPELKYVVSIKLNLADTVQFAVRNFGLVFTQEQPVNDLNLLLGLQSQVSYTEASFLDDSAGWMNVEGSFIASGGEQFLTLGNFEADADTDTLRVRHDGLPISYYYVDDVVVMLDTSYHVGVDEELGMSRGGLTVYPNPATDALTVETLGRDLAFELLDVPGKVVLQQTMQAARQNIDVSQLPTGVYVAVLRQKGVAVARRKVVIQR